MKGLQKTYQKGGGDQADRPKGYMKSLQEAHAQVLKNIHQNIGKPTIVEAQRILRILDCLYDNLLIFMYLDTEFIARFLGTGKNKLPEEQVKKISKEGFDLLYHQAELEAQYKPYASMIDQANKDDQQIEEDKKKEAERLKKLLEKNFKSLVRFLSENQQDFKIIKSLKQILNQDIENLVHCIDCQRVIYLKKLSTAFEELEQHQSQLKEKQENIKKLEEKKEVFEDELKKLKQEKEKFQEEKNQEIKKLEDEIEEVKLEKKKRIESLAKETESKIQQLKKDHQSKVEKLKEELYGEKSGLQKKFDETKKANNNAEKALKKLKTDANGILDDNIRQYDIMMEQKVKEKSELQSELDNIHKNLMHLKDHFAKIEEERAREQALEEEFRKRKEQWEINERRKQEAAKCILKAYREYKNNSKKKKKKRGGKKKN